jgi:hypothetical protein
MRRGDNGDRKSWSGPRWLAIGFLVINVPIETAYAWRAGLGDPYYIIKVVAWALLARGAWGAWSAGDRSTATLAFTAAGWGWLAANFARATADRVQRVGAGGALRWGSIELWFTTTCLMVALIGLLCALTLASLRDRATDRAVGSHEGTRI